MKNHKPQKKHLKFRNSAFETLTAVALILPGLLVSPASVYAADDEVDFQYSHYQEGKRDIYIDAGQIGMIPGTPGSILKAPNNLNPIEADSLYGSSRISLTDRVKFGFNYTQDTWAGATPIATAPAVSSNMMGIVDKNAVLVGASPLLANALSGKTFLDLKGNFYDYSQSVDPYTGYNLPGVKNNQLTHTMASASPETRHQGDFKLSYDWDNVMVNAGGGISTEKDYESRFGNLGARLDFNQKRTSVNLGLSYTNSDTHATLDPYTWGFFDPGTYANDAYYAQQPTHKGNILSYTGYSPQTEGTLIVNNLMSKDQYGNNVEHFASATLQGNRQDVTSELGLTQVLTKNSQMELGLGYSHSAGFLSNPYKMVYDFTILPTLNSDPNQPWAALGQGKLEARPHERNQITGNFGYQYYVEAFNAALHTHYTVAHDDWGINAHTFSADWVQPLGAGWSVTPKVRYYSQSAANFYAPYFISVMSLDQYGNYANSPQDKAFPTYQSSDQRLSGFGAISGGLTVAKQFVKGISLEAGFEYYSHQGGLKLGGGGEQAFADYDYWSANAALKLNLGALRFSGGRDTATHASHHQAELAPAGLMFNHALAQAGDMMAGYRYMRNEQSGSMLAGSSTVDQNGLVSQACGEQTCMMTPNYMAMNMHMLELMYAPTNRLTLMLMPQWTDMTMNMTHLTAAVTNSHDHNLGAQGINNHQSGGIGDTGFYALFKLIEQPGQQVVLSLGGTAPTGDAAVVRRKNTPYYADIPMDYGMQLGSGTWDLKPSLTYSGSLDAFVWGAQVTGTKRLETRNQSGYALGDIFQGSVWGGYHWTDWVSSTVRGIYTRQDRIHGEFKPITDPASAGYVPFTQTYTQKAAHVSPSDFSANYGGQFVDVGLGVNVTIPGGTFAGNTIKFEWLQPVHTDYNGYQLDRSAALTATWGVGF